MIFGPEYPASGTVYQIRLIAAAGATADGIRQRGSATATGAVTEGRTCAPDGALLFRTPPRLNTRQSGMGCPHPGVGGWLNNRTSTLARCYEIGQHFGRCGRDGPQDRTAEGAMCARGCKTDPHNIRRHWRDIGNIFRNCDSSRESASGPSSVISI